MQKNSYLLDAIALVVLMVMVAIMAAFIPPSEVPGSLWIGIYFAWAAGALFVWHRVGAEWRRWPLIAASSMGGAALWYLATRTISHLIFGDGESELSKVFDIGVALILSPGLTFIAIAGWARGLMQRKSGRSSSP